MPRDLVIIANTHKKRIVTEIDFLRKLRTRNKHVFHNECQRYPNPNAMPFESRPTPLVLLYSSAFLELLLRERRRLGAAFFLLLRLLEERRLPPFLPAETNTKTTMIIHIELVAIYGGHMKYTDGPTPCCDKIDEYFRHFSNSYLSDSMLH